MFIILVGAGRTGRRVLELATQQGHEVVVIEQDHERAQTASEEFDCIAINDDGASQQALIEADIEDADALIATTDDDATNVLVMMHGRDFEVPSLVSSVNDDANARLYRQLSVNTVESPHRLNGEYLYRAVQRPSIQDFMEVGQAAEIFEITVDQQAEIAGLTLDEAGRKGLFDDETIVVAIQRGGDVHIPRGQTRIEAGDLVTVFSVDGATEATTRPFKKHDL
jgi:trk system potassium uptake protein TrkA